MANTKLSNTYGLESAIKGIPAQIESYTNELHENVISKKRESLYYSEKSVLGIITCILLVINGVNIIAAPDVILDFFEINIDVLATYYTLVRVMGLLILLLGIHGIGQMMFAGRISRCDKEIGKSKELFKKQFDTASEEITISQMEDMIEHNKDEELSEEGSLDNKLAGSVEMLFSRNELVNKLTRVSRIVLPIILYFMAMSLAFKSDSIGAEGVAIAFVFMIVFSRRICLLLEYKVSTFIRAVMAVPAFVYGFVLYFKLKSVYIGMCFLPYNIQTKLSEGIQPYFSSAFIICMAQVVVLVLSVLFQDYYSEKKQLQEGLRLDTGGKKHKRWYIYYSVVFDITLYVAYIIIMMSDMDAWKNLSSVWTALIMGIKMGVTWRVISPIWPDAGIKAIRKFLGTRYSMVVSAFIFVIIATLFFLNGFVFTGYSLVGLIAMIISSWIVFALMVQLKDLFGKIPHVN